MPRIGLSSTPGLATDFSFLLMQTRGFQKSVIMAQVGKFLPLMWETYIEFLSPSSGVGLAIGVWNVKLVDGNYTPSRSK